MYQITDILNYENHTFSSCIPLFWGMENCAKGHSYGPRTRDYILIHLYCPVPDLSLWRIRNTELFPIRHLSSRQMSLANILPARPIPGNTAGLRFMLLLIYCLHSFPILRICTYVKRSMHNILKISFLKSWRSTLPFRIITAWRRNSPAAI